MRNGIFIFFLFISSLTYAHSYYFAFAELEYNEFNKELQATVVVSTHDIENSLRNKGIITKDLSHYKNDSLVLIQIKNELQKGFLIFSNDQTINWDIVGMETELTGVTNFYFYAQNVDATEKIQVKFDLLMDDFTEQQNKLTFIYRNVKNTYVFLTNKREQEIILSEL